MDWRRKRALYRRIIARIEVHRALRRFTVCDLAELQGRISGSKPGLPAGRALTEDPRTDGKARLGSRNS